MSPDTGPFSCPLRAVSFDPLQTLAVCLKVEAKGASMFKVKEVRRGFLRDKAWVVANADASHSRRMLTWDAMGAPDLKHELVDVRVGGEFVIAVRRNSVETGQTINAGQVASWWAFRKLWRRFR